MSVKASGTRSPPRGYLLLEVLVSGVILATALVGTMLTIQRANLAIAEAAKESQASQILQMSISQFVAYPCCGSGFGVLPDVTDKSLGDVFRFSRTSTVSNQTITVPGGGTLPFEELDVTITYNLPTGGQRSLVGKARRF